MDVPNISMSCDADVPAITAICAHHVDTCTASFETLFMQLALGEGPKTSPDWSTLQRHVPSRRLRPARYPDRTNFWKHRGVNGASRAAAPEATVTSPT